MHWRWKMMHFLKIALVSKKSIIFFTCWQSRLGLSVFASFASRNPNYHQGFFRTRCHNKVLDCNLAKNRQSSWAVKISIFLTEKCQTSILIQFFSNSAVDLVLNMKIAWLMQYSSWEWDSFFLWVAYQRLHTWSWSNWDRYPIFVLKFEFHKLDWSDPKIKIFHSIFFITAHKITNWNQNE